MIRRTAVAELFALVVASISTTAPFMGVMPLVEAKNESKSQGRNDKVGNIRKLSKQTSTTSVDFAIEQDFSFVAATEVLDDPTSAIPSDAPSLMPSIIPSDAPSLMPSMIPTKSSAN